MEDISCQETKSRCRFYIACSAATERTTCIIQLLPCCRKNCSAYPCSCRELLVGRVYNDIHIQIDERRTGAGEYLCGAAGPDWPCRRFPLPVAPALTALFGWSSALSYQREARALPLEPFFGDRSRSRHLPFSNSRPRDDLGGDCDAGPRLSIRLRCTKLLVCGAFFTFSICGTERVGVDGGGFRSRSAIASCTSGSLPRASLSAVVCCGQSRAK